MAKIMSLDKQLELKAKKWFINTQLVENRREARNLFYEEKEEVIEEYLFKHPKMKQQYETKKKQLLQLKLIAASTLMVTTLSGGYVLSKSNAPKENLSKIEHEVDLKDSSIEEPIQELEEDSRNYDEFFKEAREIDDIDEMEKMITDYTKGIIIEAYNEQNPTTFLTADKLEIFILDEMVLKKEDRLGNYTYERIPQDEKIILNENEEVVRIGIMYDFKVDGETVAVFDGNKDVIPDRNVENPDISFRSMIDLIEQSTRLKNIYKFSSNDYQKIEVEEAYKLLANDLLNIEKQEEYVKEER